MCLFRGGGVNGVKYWEIFENNPHFALIRLTLVTAPQLLSYRSKHIKPDWKKLSAKVQLLRNLNRPGGVDGPHEAIFGFYGDAQPNDGNLRWDQGVYMCSKEVKAEAIRKTSA